MTEIIRLIGYSLFAAGLLVILYEILVYFIEREEDRPYRSDEDWWDY